MAVCQPRLGRVVVLNDSGVALGGATSIAIASALGAAEVGLEVTFITAQGTVDDRLAHANVRVVEITGQRISPANRLGTALEGLWRKATLDVVGAQVDKSDTPGTVYHLHNWHHFLSPSVFQALRSVSDRLFISTHDQFLACPNGAQYNFRTERSCDLKGGSSACAMVHCDRRSRADKAWRYARHWLRTQAMNLDRTGAQIVVLHPTQRDMFLRAGVRPEQLHILRNPAEAFVSEKRVVAEANEEVLFVGRLAFEKGADLAAQAAAVAQVPIRFLGDGPLRAQLTAQFPQFCFDGHVDRATLAKAAGRARLLVLPSRWPEPFGLVVPEALWSGLPVICSHNAHLAPEIARLEVGLLVDPRDTHGFAQRLRGLSTNHSLVKSMSERAFGSSGSIAMSLSEWRSRLIDLYTRAFQTP